MLFQELRKPKNAPSPPAKQGPKAGIPEIRASLFRYGLAAFRTDVRDHALPSGVLAEQVNPYTNEPLSVSPLTWSHAAFVTAVLEYLEARRRLLSETVY